MYSTINALTPLLNDPNGINDSSGHLIPKVYFQYFLLFKPPIFHVILRLSVVPPSMNTQNIQKPFLSQQWIYPFFHLC